MKFLIFTRTWPAIKLARQNLEHAARDVNWELGTRYLVCRHVPLSHVSDGERGYKQKGELALFYLFHVLKKASV